MNNNLDECASFVEFHSPKTTALDKNKLANHNWAPSDKLIMNPQRYIDLINSTTAATAINNPIYSLSPLEAFLEEQQPT